MDSRPPMAIFELLDYIVNEVSTIWLPGRWNLFAPLKKTSLELIGKPVSHSHIRATCARRFTGSVLCIMLL